MEAYEAPTIVELGTIADMTGMDALFADNFDGIRLQWRGTYVIGTDGTS